MIQLTLNETTNPQKNKNYELNLLDYLPPYYGWLCYMRPYHRRLRAIRYAPSRESHHQYLRSK